MTHYAANPAAALHALLVLAHGAGAGHLHPFMVRYARALAARGLDVCTFNFPYMAAGRRAPDRAPVLEEAFRHAVRDAVSHPGVRADRVLVGGKSMGGRIATHLAATPQSWPADVPPLSGVIALGYPLNPPGGARRADRVAHLLEMRVPALIVQGTRDSFGGPADLRAALQGRQPLITIQEVEDGDHSLAVRKGSGKTQDAIDAEVCDAIIAWLRG